ncbi:hypothetical protein [Streptomyces dioscori]|uniref:hypothetical protein n=1 Tax=Streptomyces dioscori TaxID=2109333 RepID=UPI00131BA06B|nr:hypothetical protein [Streptomyces dioscori]
MRAHKQSERTTEAGPGQRPVPRAHRVSPRERSPHGVLALQRMAGNDAVARTLMPVQRMVTATEPAEEVKHIHDFVTEMLGAADKLIGEAKSFAWRFKSVPARQAHLDKIGQTLDGAEHMVYRQFRDDPGGKEDNAKNTGLKELLDAVQKRHFSYVEILRSSNGTRPVGMDVDADDTEAQAELSETWSRVVGGQGIATSDKPRPVGDDPDPAALPGYGTQMLSAHARLLSRQRGRALVSDLTSTSNAHSPMVSVVPYHPEVVDAIGKTDLAAQADSNSMPDARAASVDRPSAGSSTTVSAPHDFKDSEGAKPGEAVSPFFLLYGHELIHAQHNKHGINVAAFDDEETATVSGTESSKLLHAGKGMRVTTEDQLRDEHYMPRRGGYT